MNFSVDLTGKTALVTGGGKGIGRALSLGLAGAGADVVVASRTQADLESVTQEIRATGRRGWFHAIDLTAPGAVDDLIQAVIDEAGGIDILINNAARSFMRPMMDLREDGFDKIFDTNVKAVFLLSRAAAKVMMAKGGGRIVNITTVGAERGGPFMGPYFASKAAVKMLTSCMAVEWGPFNIQVNGVGPGMTRTDFSRPIWSNPDLERQITARIPQGRLGEPEDLVGAALFLCSEGASYINGQTIYVDGGALGNG